MEHVGEARAEGREPPVLGPTRRPLLEDDGVILIERQQALAPAGRAEHEQGIGTGRRAGAGPRELLFREAAGPARQGAELARDDGRDVARADALLHQACRHGGHLRPGAGERGHVRRLVDVVAKDDGAVRARAQEIPRRDRAPQLAVLTHRRDVADAEAPHAADGTVQEGLVRHGDDGARGDRRDPLVQDRGSALAQSPQDVALGDDAERRHGRAGVADEQ